MRLARKATLNTTPSQDAALRNFAGAARVAWNWGLAKRKDAYEAWKAAGKPDGWDWPNYYTLGPELTGLKKIEKEAGGFPWMREVPADTTAEALRSLNRAFDNFFAGRAKYPRFKSRHRGMPGIHCGGTVYENSVRIPRIGLIKFMPGCRGYIPCGQYRLVSITNRAGRWFVSAVPRDEHDEIEPCGRDIVGMDMGARKLAVLSDGTVYPSLLTDPMRVALRRVERIQKELSRKPIKPGQPSSARRNECKDRLARAHARVKNIRRETLHSVSTEIAKRYRAVVIEDLDLQQMTQAQRGDGRRAKSRINRVVLRSALGEFRRLLEYKGKLYGCEIIKVNPANTTKTCSACGALNDIGEAEIYVCAACGVVIDRDLNAALNILARTPRERLNAHGWDVSHAA